MSDPLAVLSRRQKSIATISEWSQSTPNFSVLAHKVAALLSQEYESTYCDIVELTPDLASMRVLAASGSEHRDRLTEYPIEPGSEAAYSLLSPEPVSLQDLRTEGRFHRPLLPYHSGVISGVSARIMGRSGPCAILAVHSAQRRSFTRGDVHYLRTLANLLGVAAARQQAEQQIHLQSCMLDAVQDAVIAVDNRARVLYWNHGAEVMYGWRSDEAVGSELDELAPLAERPAQGASWIGRFGSRRSFSAEMLVQQRSGIRLLVRVDSSPLRDRANNIIGAVTVHCDLVERRWVEQAHRYAQETLEARVAERTDELTQTNRLLQEEIAERERFAAELAEVRRLLEGSREQERLHLARDLHDGPLQDLMSVNMELAAFARSLREEEKVAHVLVLRARQERIARELRTIAQELRPPLLAHFGLAEAIRAHAGQIPLYTNVPAVDFSQVYDSPPLPEATVMALFRIYQQAVQNVLQHAQAAHLTVRLHTAKQALTLEIEDDGCGFAVPPNWVGMAREQHFGLIGISERAQGITGRFDVRSAPGEGTLIRVTVPLPPAS